MDNFIFTIIINNVDEKIFQTIDSLINQDISFSKFIQIIILIDTNNILMENILYYQNKYPNNFFIFSYENLSNITIKNLYPHIKGNYIAFLNSGDIYNKELLSIVNKTYLSTKNSIIKLNENCIDDTIYFEDILINENILLYNFNINTFIIKNSLLFRLININAYFKINNNLIKKLFMDEKSFTQINNLDISLVDNLNINYDYESALNKLNEFEDIITYTLEKMNNIPLYIQNSIIFELQFIINQPNMEFTNDITKESFFNLIHKILNFVDENLLINCKCIKGNLLKNAIMFYKINQYDEITFEDNVKLNIGKYTIDNIKSHKIYVDRFESNNGVILLKGFFNSAFDINHISIEALIETANGVQSVIGDYVKYAYRNNYTTLSKTWLFKHNFIITIPNSNQKQIIKLKINYHKNHDKTDFNPSNLVSFFLNVGFDNKSNINYNINKVILDNKEIIFENNEFKIINKTYNFSLIMPVYNSEKYVDKAISSIINQSINFEENVELIIINDNSDDDSLNIINKYAEKFPNNITIINNDSIKGPSYCRNIGLKNCHGLYVNFLDSDDYISENTLEEVLKFFKDHKDIGIVVSPMFNIDRENNEDYLNYKFENEIINLNKQHDCIQCSISSTFIRNNLIVNKKFNEKLYYNEGTLLINEILLETKKYATLKNIKYYFRRRYSVENLSDTTWFSKQKVLSVIDNYYIHLINHFKTKNLKIPLFIQNTLIYTIQDFFKKDLKNLFENEEEFNYFKNKVRNIIKQLDTSVILNNEHIDSNLRKFLISIKNDNLIIIQENNGLNLKSSNYIIDILNIHQIWITNLRIMGDTLNIRGVFTSNFNTENYTIKIRNNDEKIICQNFNNKTEDYLSTKWSYQYNFDVYISLEYKQDTEIYFEICYDDGTISYTFKPNLSFISNLKYVENEPIITDKYNLIFDNNIFKISKGYLFTIIMAVYNVEKYLNESINSIINQTLGFEENVQLILVNDGSTDKSGEICLDYQKKYPRNVIYLKQENQGQTVARNNGLQYARGKYLNFLDSDDYFSTDVLEKVNKFFEKHYNECDVVTIPLIKFERMTNPHMLNYKFNGTRVINLNKEPDNPLLSVSSSFIKFNSMKYLFDQRLISNEDVYLINKVLLQKNTLGIIDDVYYYYRQRTDFNSTTDTMVYSKRYYTQRLKYFHMDIINYCMINYSKIPLFIQYTLIYDLQWVVQETADLRSVFDDIDEINEFYHVLYNILQYIEINVIRKSRNIKSNSVKNFLISFKNNNSYISIYNNVPVLRTNNIQLDNLSMHNFWIDIVNIVDNNLYISGFLNSMFNTSFISIQAIKTNGDEKKSFDAKYVKYTSREDISYISKVFQYKYNFDLKIPLDKIESSKVNLVVNYHINHDVTDFSSENIIQFNLNTLFKSHARISKISNYLTDNKYIVSFKDKTFYVSNYSYDKMRQLEKSVLKSLYQEKPYGYKEAIILRILHLLLYKKYSHKHLQMYLDRWEDADDNSTYLFKYANKQKDNIKKYILISKDAKQYKSLSKIGNVLNQKTFKHKFLSLFVDQIISSHPYESQINPFFDYESDLDTRELYAGLFNPKIYFLQHGVTKDDISSWMSKFEHNLSLISTVSDKEKESFYKEGYNFDKKVIQTLGFPRFDYLKNNNEKIILIIPTWRKYLRGNKNLFLASDYYKSLNNLLSNKEFISKVKNYGYKIIFKPHPELDKKIGDSQETYTDLFEIDSEIIISRKESYNELFKKVSLLITDYSSVFFDFAYLKKPMIYYHPNDDYHYGESYFDYETMGFGAVIDNKKDLYQKIEEYLLKDCQMEEVYKNRVDSFFKYMDKNNCQRVYDWIKENQFRNKY